MLHYKQLDGLRFIAVAGVIIAHWIAWLPDYELFRNFPFRHGVLLFFVLSGFLITEILLRQKSRIEKGETSIGKELKNFYARRTLRIFPVYYILIFVLYSIDYRNVSDVMPYVSTYTTNIYIAQVNEPIGDFMHFWSLAVEEQFYIFWPLFLFLIPQKHILKFIVFIILISMALQAFYILYFHDQWCAINYQTYNIMYPLGMGSMLACIKTMQIPIYRKLSNSVILTPIAFCLFVASFYFITKKNNNAITVTLYDNFLFCVLAFVILARAVGPGFTGFGRFLLENKLFNHLGKRSYAIYLIHVSLPNLALMWYISPVNEINWAYWFLIVVLVAELSYWLVEKPINSLKRYFV